MHLVIVSNWDVPSLGVAPHEELEDSLPVYSWNSALCISCMVFQTMSVDLDIAVHCLANAVCTMLAMVCSLDAVHWGCMHLQVVYLYLCFVPFEYVLMCVTALSCFLFVSLTGDTIGWCQGGVIQCLIAIPHLQSSLTLSN